MRRADSEGGMGVIVKKIEG